MHAQHKNRLLVGLSLVCISLAAHEYFYPTTAHPTGRYSWVLGPIYGEWGSAGLIVYWLAIAAALAFIAIIKSRREK